jgi:hypothetical protein
MTLMQPDLAYFALNSRGAGGVVSYGPNKSSKVNLLASVGNRFLKKFLLVPVRLSRLYYLNSTSVYLELLK